MKIRTAFSAGVFTALSLVSGAASATAATAVDRHVDTHASYYTIH